MTKSDEFARLLRVERQNAELAERVKVAQRVIRDALALLEEMTRTTASGKVTREQWSRFDSRNELLQNWGKAMNRAWQEARPLAESGSNKGESVGQE